ncbi:hypothetical protein B0H11DRAFT_2112216 [Mycena galericulata]|nr:hypothetical protein B0H11DRAFT_2112216 [Mycena galericulata]
MKNPTGAQLIPEPKNTLLSPHVPAPARTGFSCAGTIFLGKRNRKRRRGHRPPGLSSPVQVRMRKYLVRGDVDGRGFRDAQANGSVRRGAIDVASRNGKRRKRGRERCTTAVHGETRSRRDSDADAEQEYRKQEDGPGSQLRYDSSGWWKPPLKSAELDCGEARKRTGEYAGDCGASISGGERGTGEYPVPSFTYGGGAISAPGPIGGYSLVLLNAWGCGCGQYSLTRGNLVPLEERTIVGRAAGVRARRMRRRARPQQTMKRNTAAGDARRELDFLLALHTGQ